MGLAHVKIRKWQFLHTSYQFLTCTLLFLQISKIILIPNLKIQNSKYNSKIKKSGTQN